MSLTSTDWQKVKKDLLLAASSHFFYKVAGYLILSILTRYLGKEEMGEFFFAAALANFFGLFANLGTDNYIIREVAANPEKASQYFSEVISLRLLLFSLYFIILNGFAFIFKPALVLVIFLTSVYDSLDGLYQSFGALFLGLKKVIYNVIVGVSTRLFLVGLIITIVASKGSLTEILAGYISANALLVLIAFIIFRLKVGRLKFSWSEDSVRRVVQISFPFFLMSALGLVHFKVDTLMLGFLKPYSVVATYEAAYKLLEASRFLILPIGMIFFPICSEMAAGQNWHSIRTLFRKMLLVTGIIGGGITLAVVMGAGFIMPAVFGAKYLDSISVLKILYLSVPVLYMGMIGSLVGKSIFLEKKIVKIMVVCVIINIILNGITIPFWGAPGAAWTTFVSETILAVWLIKLNFQELRVLCSREPVGLLREELDHVL
ncbi:MAG TPA: flippase [Thermodesulfobacteriota bacterium]|nr:flippase [Thermodesulfobacteriota bacterium]